MANYAGSRTNALINSIALQKKAGIKEIISMQKNAIEVTKNFRKFELTAGKSAHNHSTTTRSGKNK